MFALTDEFDSLVLHSKKQKWLEVKEKWFCKTPDCKIPGKLKIGKKPTSKLYNEHVLFKNKEHVSLYFCTYLIVQNTTRPI